MTQTAEHERLRGYRERESNWKHWGPYLSERAWGTVREDYSADGKPWTYFPHDHARSRVYRWNEDGIAGICDRNQHLCLALALWNEQDPFLKERMFGLTNPQGNHGEDVKEYWYYLDSTPTHSYMKMLYKYPQHAFPYEHLVEENARRGFDDPEFELLDTGIFDQDRYFDVVVEYAKAHQDDILVRITAINRGSDAAPLHLLPTLWFRNVWSWGYEAGPIGETPGKPALWQVRPGTVVAEQAALGTYHFYTDEPVDLLFTGNETNRERLWGEPNRTPYVKDAFHRYLVDGEERAINPAREGTKVAAHFARTLGPGERMSIRLRLSHVAHERPFADFDEVFEQRHREADEFYTVVQNAELDEDQRRLQRQAFAGMLWSKQLYYYDIVQWLKGDPAMPPPPASRRTGRNSEWEHLWNFDPISMPDKWEYPWYATWDLAFHCIPLTWVDPDFAKRQLELLTREWYMHPNGQLPAYEWNFGNVNPPVHAWAAWRVYTLDAELSGKPDREFLEGIFHKLLLNFTWWVNRKDEEGRNVFEGGFLGMDNISVFDRSEELPKGGHLDQADGTAWMAAYCLHMMTIALELAKEAPVYQDSATKMFEHFLRIAHAMTSIGADGYALWDETDGFFYDVLHLPGKRMQALRVHSLVGLLPLFSVATIEPTTIERMPIFTRRMNWFMDNRPNLSDNVMCTQEGHSNRYIAALLMRERLMRVLAVMLDEEEFLSPYGIRSLSKRHKDDPFEFKIDGKLETVAYWPAESRSGLFGGNSNWRGPIWFPINYLIIEALHTFYDYYGDEVRVACPTGSDTWMTLREVANELSRRLTGLFLPDANGKRPIYGGSQTFQEDPHWREYVLFYEYFHGDNGTGLGASHQTGWTGLVADLLQWQSDEEHRGSV